MCVCVCVYVARRGEAGGCIWTDMKRVVHPLLSLSYPSLIKKGTHLLLTRQRVFHDILHMVTQVGFQTCNSLLYNRLSDHGASMALHLLRYNVVWLSWIWTLYKRKYYFWSRIKNYRHLPLYIVQVKMAVLIPQLWPKRILIWLHRNRIPLP